ncbi:MAG: U32 family peptidase, partial [Oscillospiraceae bacterium]|nr:U32 family peptidase [Oscillospiraceae bacterium]
MEALQAAFTFGADAVYLAGQSFGMRAAAKNFNDRQLESAIKFAHGQNRKVYVTCNIVAHNRELEQMPEFLEKLDEFNADGVILSDIGVLAAAKKYAPNVPVH